MPEEIVSAYLYLFAPATPWQFMEHWGAVVLFCIFAGCGLAVCSVVLSDAAATFHRHLHEREGEQRA